MDAHRHHIAFFPRPCFILRAHKALRCNKRTHRARDEIGRYTFLMYHTVPAARIGVDPLSLGMGREIGRRSFLFLLCVVCLAPAQAADLAVTKPDLQYFFFRNGIALGPSATLRWDPPVRSAGEKSSPLNTGHNRTRQLIKKSANADVGKSRKKRDGRGSPGHTRAACDSVHISYFILLQKRAKKGNKKGSCDLQKKGGRPEKKAGVCKKA